MTSELFIERYPADLSSDLSALITFELDNVKDFSSRSTSWSKTVVLPGTARNNKIFGHIFQAGQSNQHDISQRNVNYNFNASKSASCLIFQDQIQAFKGVLRLLQINIINGRMEYEVGMFGEISSLTSALTGGLLTDLDFSAYDHNYTETNITNSWDAAPGTGIYYPLIDYGTASALKHNWDIKTFRPALYVREYIDKIFTAAGFRWSSALLETTRFKRLVIPHNQKRLTRLDTALLSAERTTNLTVLTSAGTASDDLNWESVTTAIFTPSGPNRIFTYNGADPITVNVDFDIRGTRRSLVTSFTIEVRKNGVLIPGQTVTYPTNAGTFTIPYYFFGNFDVSLVTNDTLEFYFVANQSGSDINYLMTVDDADLSITTTIPTAVDVTYGTSVVVNNTIPKNVSQIEFFSSIIKLFNLYVYEDKVDSKLVYITPYIDFYSLSATDSVDWTYKLNRDKAIKIRPMSEINAKKYDFKYKADTDYFNDLYKKRYNEGYGDYYFDSAFEFAEKNQSVDLIFSATPLVGYTGEEKVYSTIFKLNSGIEESIDSNIRILQTKKVTGVANWNLLNGVTTLTTLTSYGYAGHFDDPDAPDNDLNFGNVRELFFTLVTGNLTRTQFNVYWSAYMAEITDKDSKLLSAWFYLNTTDIFSLDFSKKIMVDGVLFRLNSIRDYNISRPSDCVVELLKINYLNY